MYVSDARMCSNSNAFQPECVYYLYDDDDDDDDGEWQWKHRRQQQQRKTIGKRKEEKENVWEFTPHMEEVYKAEE